MNKPCNVEEAMGIPLRELIETHAGGVRGGWDNLLGGDPRRLVGAAGAGGADQRRLLMDFDALREAQVGPRHRGGDRDGQVHRHHPAIARLSLFLQARELRPVHAVPRGHGLDVARDDAHGRRPRAQARDRQLLDVTKQVEGHTICALGDAAAWPIQGLIAHFRHEIEERIDRYAANPHSDPVRVAAE